MRILPPALFLITAVAMTAAHLALPSPFQLGPPWRLLGLLLLAGGLSVNITAARQFFRTKTNIKTF